MAFTSKRSDVNRLNDFCFLSNESILKESRKFIFDCMEKVTILSRSFEKSE